jgi:hypothetical protein
MSHFLREYKFGNMTCGDHLNLNSGDAFLLLKSKKIRIDSTIGDRFLNILLPCGHGKLYWFYSNRPLETDNNIIILAKLPPTKKFNNAMVMMENKWSIVS